MSNDSFECLGTLGTTKHPESFSVMVRKWSFWETAEIVKNELKYLGHHKTHILKGGNKNVLCLKYPGGTVRDKKILGIPNPDPVSHQNTPISTRLWSRFLTKTAQKTMPCGARIVMDGVDDPKWELSPGVRPCWRVLMRSKQQSKAATARVLCLCVCVRYWSYHGAGTCASVLTLVLFT